MTQSVGLKKGTISTFKSYTGQNRVSAINNNYVRVTSSLVRKLGNRNKNGQE